jgi:tripartite-type tricarboxylate transporter receptor subunit TctC
MTHIRTLGTLAAAGLVLGLTGTGAHADTISDFYSGKRMTMLIGLSTGGAYDRYARVTARHLSRFIPGNPTIIPRNMTGGGSLVMTNFLYNVAPQDGTHIGAPNRAIPTEPLVNGSKSKAKFQPLKLHWIGSLMRETSIGVTWHTSGIKTYKDLYTKEFLAGGTGGGSDSVTIGYMFRNLLGMKIRMIVGYPGGNEINLAMQRGEVMGRVTNSWSAIKSGDYTRVQEGKLILLYQMGAKKNNEGILKDVPLALDFAKDKKMRQVLFLKFGVNEFGYPYVMGPGVPADRVAAVRTAFIQMSKDAKLLAEAKKARMDIDPIYGAEMQNLLKEMFASPPDVIAALRAASVPPETVEKAKLSVITATVKLGKISKKGAKVSFKGRDEKGNDLKGSVSISGSKTKITIAGKPAKRDALKTGMACTVTYQGRSAKEISCK